MTVRNIYIFFIGALIIDSFFIAWTRRPLLSDGYNFLYWIIHQDGWGLDGRFYRWIGVVLQLPSIIISHYLTFIPDWNNWLTIFYCIGYAFHPQVSWLLCFLISRKYGRTEYMLFPLLSYALITAAVMPSPSTTPETISVFWPLFFFVAFGKLKGFWELTWVFVLSLLLAFCYETSILFFFVNIAILVFRMRKENILSSSSSRRIGWLLAFLFQAFGVLWMLYRLYASPLSSFVSGGLGMDSMNGGYRFFTVAGTFSLIAMLLRPRLTTALIAMASSLLALYVGLVVFRFQSEAGFLFASAMIDRTRSVPLICIIALMAYRHYAKKLSLPRHLHYFCFFCLSVALVYSSFLNYSFHRIMNISSQFAKNNPGCNVMSLQDFDENFFGAGLGDWWFPLATSKPDRTLQPSSMFIVEAELTGESCIVRNGFFGREEYMIFPIQGRIDFSQIIKGPIRFHRWNRKTQIWETQEAQR